MPEGCLFPHFVCRVAGLPGDVLVSLRASGAMASFDEVLRLEAALKEQATPLTDILFQAIEGQEDVAIRRALLRLKRDAHNMRSTPERHFETASTVLDASEQQTWQRFAALLEQHDATWKRYRQLYVDEVATIRSRFQGLVNAESFRHGLLLSSRSLSDQVERYRRASPKKPKAKERQVERSLMRYISRTVMKATPFSTLCSLLPGRWTADATAPRFDGPANRQTSHIRLNKSIYARLLSRILVRPAIRRHLCVELNPTLERDVAPASEAIDQPPWVLLSAEGNTEVFHRLAHPVVDLLHGHLSTTGPIPLGQLVNALANHPDIDTDSEQAAAFIEHLLKIGLLRFRLGIGEQEVHWDAPLGALLADIDDDLARGVRRFLTELRALVDGYGTADLATRRRKLEDSHRLLRSFFAEIGAPPPGPSFEVFYEDASGSASLQMASDGLQEVLKDYVAWTSRLAWPRGEQANMRRFFETYYPTGQPVPLLRFYEDYYRQHFKEHLAHGQRGGPQESDHRPEDAETETVDPANVGSETVELETVESESVDSNMGSETVGSETVGSGNGAPEGPATQSPGYDPNNPFDLEYIRQLDRAVKGMHALLQERWQGQPEAEALELTQDDFAGILAELPPANERVRSATFFAQYLPDLDGQGTSALVTRSYLAGYGKYFSRFLYLLPEQIHHHLLDLNRRRSEQMLAEICGDANFNANLHPPMVPWELSYPTGESGVAEQQIRTSEVDVEMDPDSPHRLRLRHRRADKVVIPVDLGFLNPRMRPPLFQLLTRFAPADNFTMMIPELPRDGEAPPPVLYRPRIVYRQRLVLARRQWRVAGDIFPLASSEDAVEYFARMQRWRVGIGLPREVFVRIHVLGTKVPEPTPTPAPGVTPDDPVAETPGGAAAVEPQKIKGPSGVREHLYKPQYIDFANPLLVELLGRGAENLSRYYLVFEECLPHRQQFLTDDQHPYATELILQVDMDQPASPEAPL